jgi:N-acetylmuramoyl-L-alanine amidase
MRGIVVGILVSCCLPLMAAAQTISSVAVTTGPGGVERLQLVADNPLVPTKIFTLANPDRVVIDLPRISSWRASLPPGYQGGLIRKVRFGQFSATTSRIVVEVAAPVKVVGTLPSGPQLLVDIAPVNPGAPIATGTIPPPVKPLPLIVIDAGHGGQDPGALGLHGTKEKYVTLAFARALRDGLLKTGRYRVTMTRADDRFVMLPERVNMGRRAKGDIFISLHADSNPRRDARGLSIYTLSENASDDEAAALAVRENKSDIIAGLDLNTADEDVASILIDLTQRETMNKSALLADDVVSKLHPKITRLERTHRFAGFRVLKAPDIPSVLVEIGFLSNAADEKLLQSGEYQTLVVDSIIKAFDQYAKDEGL